MRRGIRSGARRRRDDGTAEAGLWCDVPCGAVVEPQEAEQGSRLLSRTGPAGRACREGNK